MILRLGYHHRNNDTATLKNTGNARNLVTGGTQDIGSNRVHLAYGINKGLNSAMPRNTANPFGYATPPVFSTNSCDVLVGLTVPYGAHTLMASWIGRNDRTRFNQDAHQFALGQKYNLLKRTELYAVYGHMTNKHGAGYTVASAIENGTGDKAVDLGIRHAFQNFVTDVQRIRSRSGANLTLYFPQAPAEGSRADLRQYSLQYEKIIKLPQPGNHIKAGWRQ